MAHAPRTPDEIDDLSDTEVERIMEVIAASPMYDVQVPRSASRFFLRSLGLRINVLIHALDDDDRLAASRG